MLLAVTDRLTEQIVSDGDQGIVQILPPDADRTGFTRRTGLPCQLVPPAGALHHRKEPTHVERMIVQQRSRQGGRVDADHAAGQKC
jgi:hypothetical protein